MRKRPPRIEWINVIIVAAFIPFTLILWLWAIPLLARWAAALFTPH